MKYVSCSKCGQLVPPKKTDVLEGKRVCHSCKKKVK